MLFLELDFDAGYVSGEEDKTMQSPVTTSPSSSVSTRSASKSIRSRQPWLPRDKQALASMKGKGWSDERIAKALGRSGGAVAQQCRKQREE
jgi:hypothetical protein